MNVYIPQVTLMSKPKKKRCRWCGKSFMPVRDWQEYDSAKCRKLSFEQRRKELIRAAQVIVQQKISEAS
jgi:hypothetical protein